MKSLFDSFISKITEYLQLRFANLRLNVVEDIAKTMGFIAFFLIVGGMAMLAFIYLSFGFAIYLGNLFNHLYIGMLLTGGLVVLLIFLLFMFRKAISGFVVDKSIAFLMSLRKNKKD